MDKLVSIFCFGIGCLTLWTYYRPSLNTFVFAGFWDWFIPLFLFLASIVAWFDLANWLGIKTRFWRKRKDGPKVHEFIFDDLGAEFKTGEPATVQVRLVWDEFRKVRESNQVFLLIPKDSGFWAIPKHYLIESDQLEVFESLSVKRFLDRTAVCASLRGRLLPNDWGDFPTGCMLNLA